MSPEEFLRVLRGETEVPFAPHDLFSSIEILAKREDPAAFKELMDSYVQFTQKHWQDHHWGNPAMARAGALENLACAAAQVDHPETEESLAALYWSRKYGPAMRMFLLYTGYSGEEVSFLMESTGDPFEKEDKLH